MPTCGRASLADTLGSIAAQSIWPGDEVIVVADGTQPMAREIVEEAAQHYLPVRYLVHGPTRDFGNSQRNFAYAWAHGTHILHMDDDDVFTEEAFIKVRKVIAKHPNEALMFRMLAVWGEVIWRNQRIERGNTITPMLVVPYVRGAMPTWPRKQGGDVDVMQYYAGRLVWREELIAVGRPQEEAKWWRRQR